MPHNHLTEGKKEPISWVIHRTVCRSPILLKRFEVHPHGVCWIRQSAVCESVRGKKVAEFVSNFGLRNNGESLFCTLFCTIPLTKAPTNKSSDSHPCRLLLVFVRLDAR